MTPVDYRRARPRRIERARESDRGVVLEPDPAALAMRSGPRHPSSSPRCPPRAGDGRARREPGRAWTSLFRLVHRRIARPLRRPPTRHEVAALGEHERQDHRQQPVLPAGVVPLRGSADSRPRTGSSSTRRLRCTRPPARLPSGRAGRPGCPVARPGLSARRGGRGKAHSHARAAECLAQATHLATALGQIRVDLYPKTLRTRLPSPGMTCSAIGPRSSSTETGRRSPSGWSTRPSCSTRSPIAHTPQRHRLPPVGVPRGRAGHGGRARGRSRRCVRLSEERALAPLAYLGSSSEGLVTRLTAAADSSADSAAGVGTTTRRPRVTEPVRARRPPAVFGRLLGGGPPAARRRPRRSPPRERPSPHLRRGSGGPRPRPRASRTWGRDPPETRTAPSR